MRISNFKKFINSLNEEELREEMLRLYSKLDDVKTFYKMDLGSEKERAKVFDRAKKDIAKKYLTKSYRKPRRPRIQKVNKILSEVRKSTVLDYEMIDVYLFTCETALEFKEEYQFYSDVLINNISSTFEKACNLIKSNLMQEDYQNRCENIMKKLKYSRELKLRLTPKFTEVFEK